MDTFLKDKKFNTIIFILLLVISLFFIAKFVNEVKQSNYIGRGNQPANTISVSGEGEAIAVSDIASISVSLSKEAKTTKEATRLLNKSLTLVLDYLKKQNIVEKDIKSEYGGLNPKYSYPSNIVCITYPCPPRKDPIIVGYTAKQSITIKVRKVDNASRVRTGLANLGITNISGPTFKIDDNKKFINEARSKAIIDAKAKAEVLVSELGVKLGKVVNFSENNNSRYPGVYGGAKSMMSSSIEESAPVLPKGENKVKSTVYITYEIR